MSSAKNRVSELNINFPGSFRSIDPHRLTDFMLGPGEQYLSSIKRNGFIEPQPGIPLYYELYTVINSRATILLLVGWTETIQKYMELIYYFTSNGYSVCAMDYRGHGYSYRGVSDLSKTHLTDYRHYIDDLYCFIKDVVIEWKGSQPLYVFSHSMGGAVAAGFMEKYPGIVSKAVLSVPMFGMHFEGIPVWLAKLVCDIGTFLGLGEMYAPGEHPFDGYRDFSTSCTDRRERFDYYFDKRILDEMLRNWGSTIQWVREAIKMTRYSYRNCARITEPVLVFTCDKDEMVDNRKQFEFVRKVPSATQIVVKNCRHELHTTSPEYLDPYMNTVFAFFAQ